MGTETERFAGTSVAEVINSSGSLSRSQCYALRRMIEATYVSRIYCWVGHADPISCRPSREHPPQGVPEPDFPFLLWCSLHQSALSSRVPTIANAQRSRRISGPLPFFWDRRCRSSMAEALRKCCFQLLFRVIPSEEAIRAGITKVSRRKAFGE